jgi:hypothetical protein
MTCPIWYDYRRNCPNHIVLFVALLEIDSQPPKPDVSLDRDSRENCIAHLEKMAKMSHTATYA